MHTMQKTPKIITIVGLVLEGIGALSTLGGAYFVSLHRKIENFAEIMEMTQEEYEEFIFVFDFLSNFLYVLGGIILIIFIVNLILFSKLIQGKFSEETATKVYLYQAIWGGINIIFNTVTGILYLISGVQGYNGTEDMPEVREGI